MAKKTVVRKQGESRRKPRSPEPKGPPILAKLPPEGMASAKSSRGKKKAAAALPANRAVEAPKRAPKDSRVAAERAFVKGLVARGEVAEAGAPLQAGMTHEAVGQKRSGTPRVTRRRFSLR